MLQVVIDDDVVRSRKFGCWLLKFWVSFFI